MILGLPEEGVTYFSNTLEFVTDGLSILFAMPAPLSQRKPTETFDNSVLRIILKWFASRHARRMCCTAFSRGSMDTSVKVGRGSYYSALLLAVYRLISREHCTLLDHDPLNLVTTRMKEILPVWLGLRLCRCHKSQNILEKTYGILPFRVNIWPGTIVVQSE